jgi:cytochrome c
MHLSKFKKLTLCALALILMVWGIEKAGNYLVSSKTIKNNVFPLIETAADGPKNLNLALQKTNPEVAAALLMLTSANVNDGKMVFKKCQSCHSVHKDGKNKIGPNLWDIVGRSKASATNYRFSKALGNLGGNWSYKDLDRFLTNPKDFAKGTKMSFSGIKNAKSRADLIIYLRSLSDQPIPLP